MPQERPGARLEFSSQAFLTISIFIVMASIISAAPITALYSRCLRYSSRENCDVTLSPDQRGRIRGTRRAYSSKSGNVDRRNDSSLRITGTYTATKKTTRTIQIHHERAEIANPTAI